MRCEDSFSNTAQGDAERARNMGPLSDFNGHARITGPCGDTMEFWLLAQEGSIQRVSFVTDGCSTSIACGSMAACLAEGKEVQNAACLQDHEILTALGGLPEHSQHCALLAANTLKAACEDYLAKQKRASGEESFDGSAACKSCGDSECPTVKRKQGESDAELADRRKLESRLCRIKHKIVVLSGK